MKLTAMIKHLEGLLEKHGDQDCFYSADDMNTYSYDEESPHNLPVLDKREVFQSTDWDCNVVEEREGIYF